MATDRILRAVASHFSLKVVELKDVRNSETNFPRQIAMYLLRKHCKESYPWIGIRMGGTDHSTVLNAIRSITQKIDTNVELRATLSEIESQFQT